MRSDSFAATERTTGIADANIAFRGNYTATFGAKWKKMSNKIARMDSTLLAVIDQCRVRGEPYEYAQKYIDRLSLQSSRDLVDALFGRPCPDVSLREWAEQHREQVPSRRVAA